MIRFILDATYFGYSTLSTAGYMAWNYPSTVLLTGRIGSDVSSYFASQETSRISNLVQDCFASFTSWLPNPLRKIPQYNTPIPQSTLAAILKASKEIGSQDLKHSWPGFMQYLRACQIEWHRNLYTFIDGKCVNPHRVASSTQKIRTLAEAELKVDSSTFDTIQSQVRKILSQQDSNSNLTQGELYQFTARQIAWGLFNWGLRYSVILAFEPCIPNYFNGVTKLVATIGFMYLLLPGKIAKLSEPSSSTNALLDSEKINSIVAEASKHAEEQKPQIEAFRKKLQGLQHAPLDFAPFAAPQIPEKENPQDPSQWKIGSFLDPLWNLTRNCKDLMSKYASRLIPEWASKWILEKTWIPERIGNAFERIKNIFTWIKNAFSPPASTTNERTQEKLDPAIVESIKKYDPAAQLDFGNIKDLSQEAARLKGERDALNKQSVEWQRANILYSAVSVQKFERKSQPTDASQYFQKQFQSTVEYFKLIDQPELIPPYIKIKEEELKSKEWENKTPAINQIKKIKSRYLNNNNA